MMLKYFYKLKRKKAFTLVEMIVVIAIIGVLASIIIPLISSYYVRSQVASANTSAKMIKDNIELSLLELNLQGKGLKLGSDRIAQIFFMVKNGVWTSKAESKPIGVSDHDGSYVFYDHKNWWFGSKNQTMLDTTTRSDPNHLLALTRVVHDTLPNIDTAFIGAFFSNGKCDGVIYIKDCDIVWPTTRAGIRPCILNNPNAGKRKGMNEFWPYKGNWPASADKTIWNGVEGVDMDGYIVGTCPVIRLDVTK